MTHWLLLARYFWIASPMRPPIVALFVALLGVLVGLVLLRPGGFPLPLGGLLVLQAFAAASGVEESVRSGYFDGLLARGLGRAEILVGQWVASTGPGLACWCVVSGIGLACGVADGARACSSGSWLALWLVSSVPWAATVLMPRFSGAIVWVVVATTWTDLSGRAAPAGGRFDHAPGAESPRFVALVESLLRPASLVGRSLDLDDLVTLWPALALSAAAVAAAFWWFQRASLGAEVEP